MSNYTNDKHYTCCICGRVIHGQYGNDPWPVVMTLNAQCCDDCNNEIVVPARIAKALKKEDK